MKKWAELLSKKLEKDALSRIDRRNTRGGGYVIEKVFAGSSPIPKSLLEKKG